MLKKTITKNFAFVIFLTSLGGLFSSCSAMLSSRDTNDNRAAKETSAAYGNPRVVGTIKTGEITESSGFVASKCQTGTFWTHNDSGDDAFIFALNSKGEKFGTFKVENAKNVDWEDIAAFKDASSECFLYIGDIGNNAGKRSDLVIYRVKEPSVSAADKNSSRKNPIHTEPAEAIKFDYPDGRHDAETLLVHPQTGDIYILSKQLSGASGVYKLSGNYNSKKINRLVKISDFTVPAIPNGFLTGGDVSSDGRRIIICDYFSAYEIILPNASKDFDDIWKEKPSVVELGERAQGEAVCYSPDGKSIYATSEKKDSPIIQVEKK